MGVQSPQKNSALYPIKDTLARVRANGKMAQNGRKMTILKNGLKTRVQRVPATRIELGFFCTTRTLLGNF